MPIRPCHTGLLGLATVLAAGLEGQAASAWAQEVPAAPDEQPASRAAARQIYTPADFARFAPRSALDMIEQIPGFQIADDDGGRGIGQANENLLINGARVSSKSSSTADQLSRIPADNVIRIEVVDGAMLEIPGLSGRVANIIVEQGVAAGQFEWRPQFTTGPGGTALFEGDISLTGALGGIAYTIALENGAFARGSEGPAIFTDAAGVEDARSNFSSFENNRPSLNGSFVFEIAPGVAANLNLTAGGRTFRSRETERRIEGNPLPPFVEQFRAGNDEWNYEIGADVSFALGPGQLKLIALEAFEDGDFTTRSLLDLGDRPTSGTQFTRVSQEGERIGRGEYGWRMFGADWQLSAEAAFNRLDQDGRLFSFDAAAGDYVEVDFPSGAGGVREDRYEALLSVGFPVTRTLSLQLVGGGEYSQISQTGFNALSRTFERPKGSLNLAWAPAEGLDFNFEIARRVGQLDFGDFLASVDLSDDQANAGNNNLRPEQSWEARLEIANDLGPWGSATLTLFDQRIEDLVLIVPVQGGGEARGNIEDARRIGLNFNGTIQLAPIGFPGGQLNIALEWEDSQLIDPVTAVERRFDGNDPFEIELDFRHDVPETDFAWGLSFVDAERAPNYRVREVFFDHQPSTFGAVFVEHKDVLGATVQLRVGNVFDGNFTLLRTVYAGPRDASPVLFTEDRRRKSGQSINLTISGSF